MGIRGLTTYIANNCDRYLIPFDLHDSYLVIDGNSLLSQLYVRVSKCKSAFGGEYDKFANCVEKFFKNLLKCRIRPLVIFDGGYETRKLETVQSRLRNKFHTIKRCNTYTQEDFHVFPLFLKEVFKNVLKKANISYAQCCFEADDEIAALARKLGCPVLSFDSDFYVYDVMYIPFSEIYLEPLCDGDFPGKYYIKCYIYRVEIFLKRFGGLNKSLLPLMATILGNDYISRKHFCAFYNQIKIPKNKALSPTQKRIAGLLEWLRRESLESAIEKILSKMKKERRDFIEHKIRQAVEAYNLNPKKLINILNLETDLNEPETFNFDDFFSEPLEDIQSETLDEKTDTSDEEEDRENDEEIRISENIEYKISTLEMDVLSSLPTWFVENFNQGIYPSSFMDMLVHKKYFWFAQIEDYSLPQSHVISIPIIMTIFRILVGNDDAVLKCYTHNNSGSVQILSFDVSTTTPIKLLPNLSVIPKLSCNEREVIFSMCLGIKIEDFSEFPCNWKIIMIALTYWTKHMKEPCLNAAHIHALLFCIIAVNIVNKTVGYYSCKKSHSSKRKKKPLKTMTEDGDNIRKLSEDPKNTSYSTENYSDKDHLLRSLENLKVDDYVSITPALSLFFHVDEKLNGNKKLYSITTVHAFAQFQSCLMHIIQLNALLDFPVNPCYVEEFISGTFLYNAYRNFKKRSNIVDYISLLLKPAPSLLNVYKSLLQVTRKEIVVAVLDENKCHHLKKRKKKKQRSVSETKYSLSASSKSDCDDDYVDLNNKFSLLLNC